MIKAKHQDNAYILLISNILNFGFRAFPCKFDTGAVNTMLPLGMILDECTSNSDLRDVFARLCEKSNAVTEFTSAAGNKILGVKCHVNDIIISGMLIHDFYFYLTNTDRKVALLGDDFISCCTFKHIPDGDILIDNFDSNKYSRNVNTSYVREQDILEIVQVTWDDNLPNKITL